MILFTDTSAFMKLLITEDGSAEMHEAAVASSGLGAATLVYAEARSALRRLPSERGMPPAELAIAREQLRRYWPDLAVIELSRRVAEAAGDLAQRHPIRGADAVHLASALELRASGEELRFACWDDRLRNAARASGLRTLPER